MIFVWCFQCHLVVNSCTIFSVAIHNSMQSLKEKNVNEHLLKFVFLFSVLSKYVIPISKSSKKDIFSERDRRYFSSAAFALFLGLKILYIHSFLQQNQSLVQTNKNYRGTIIIKTLFRFSIFKTMFKIAAKKVFPLNINKHWSHYVQIYNQCDFISFLCNKCYVSPTSLHASSELCNLPCLAPSKLCNLPCLRCASIM